MKRMLSGIKPTGQLHLGNYIGALRHFVESQNEYEMFAFIANLHCITVPQDPQELQKNLKDCVALYLACGLDPNKATIFLQTDVKEHAQLGFIMCCHTYMGELNRMTQFKDKQAKGEKNLSGGLYTYPALMAADILLYSPDYVPVGEDQKQHVELTRDVAERMKVMSAVTDSLGKVHYDPENQPGIANLMQILSSLSNERSFEDIEKEFEGKGYGDFKKAVADAVCAKLEEIQTRYNEILNSNLIETTLANGARRARAIAEEKLNQVQKAIGMEIL